MPSVRYLNSILTIIAVLLTLNVYALWTAAPGGQLASVALEARAEAGGLPNAGKQRKDMIDELKKVTAGITRMEQTLTSGQVRVRMEAGGQE